MSFDPHSVYHLASPRDEDHPPQIASDRPLDKVHPDPTVRNAWGALELALANASDGNLNMFAAGLRNAASFATRAQEQARDALVPDDEAAWRRSLIENA